MTDSPTFGIDLGTTCSTIGWVRDGRPQLIEIDGDALLPSVVSFPERGEPLVGRPAQNLLAVQPERTIRSAKRHMGTDHRWAIGERMFGAPEVSALILRRLCQGAEEATGVRPTRVVITVPAWFRQDQRADTRRAAELAELDLVRLINEPTAAALAYAHRTDVDRRALVFDFGGGTFDASLVHQSGSVVEVLASSGDTRLGGDDLDAALVEILLDELCRNDHALYAAIEGSVPAQTRLALAAQEAKHELSSVLSATVRAPFLLDLDGEARHFEAKLRRDAVEAAALPLVERTLGCVDRVLADAGVPAHEIDELFLVGGSTRLPLVWTRLHERYGLEGNAGVPPDRAVGLGAAVQAAIVDGSAVDGILVDVAPFSLSVAALTRTSPEEPDYMICRVVTPRNAPLPSCHTELFHTVTPTQREVRIPVFQGSDPNPLRNTPLGEVSIRKLPAAPPPDLTRPIAVEFRHDLDGMVSIRVTDELSGRSVDGRVVAGGAEATGQREKLAKEWREQEIVPGDGEDPDPFLEQEPNPRAEAGGTDGTVLSGTGASSSDLEEAKRAFETLLARETELATEHAEEIFELRRLAVSGNEALADGNEEGALACYDELSDHLFELGVWL